MWKQNRLNQTEVLARALHLHLPIVFIYYGYLLLPVFKCVEYIHLLVSYVRVDFKSPLQIVSCF